MSETGITESESVQIQSRLPVITSNFNILSQIGSGTFSKVYLAKVKDAPEGKDNLMFFN
jgi:hypothetical protein